MPWEISMPQLTDTMTEGKVIRWFKAEGTPVRARDVLAEVETDKAIIELETFWDGIVAVVLVKGGQTAKVNQVLGVIAAQGENPAYVRGQYVGAPRKRTQLTRRQRILKTLRRPPP